MTNCASLAERRYELRPCQMRSLVRKLNWVTEKTFRLVSLAISNSVLIWLNFWTAKDHKLRQAVKDYESQLLQATQSLTEYKHRALTEYVTLPHLFRKFRTGISGISGIR